MRTRRVGKPCAQQKRRPSLRSGFRLAARTPPKRLKLERSDSCGKKPRGEADSRAEPLSIRRRKMTANAMPVGGLERSDKKEEEKQSSLLLSWSRDVQLEQSKIHF